MKKIMFNDKFGLTQAVLEGRKTQTRRTMSDFTAMTIQGRKKFLIASNYAKYDIDKHLSKFGETMSPYKTGDKWQSLRATRIVELRLSTGRKRPDGQIRCLSRRISCLTTLRLSVCG